MPVSPLRSLRVRLIAGVVVIEIVMLSLLVWNNLGVIRQAHADRLQNTADGMLELIAATAGRYLVEVDYASLEEYLRNIAHQDELSYLMIFDRDEHAVVTLGETPDAPWPVTDDRPLEVSDGILDIAQTIRIGGQPMGQVRMGFSLAQMNRSIDSARVRSIAIAVTGIILTILATVFIGVHLTRRLGRLATAAQRVGAGDYDIEVPEEIADEVGTTAIAFNRMVAEVSQRTRHLEESLARQRVIEQTSIDGMITYAASGHVLSANPAIQQLFGYQREDLLGKPASMLLAAISDGKDAGADYASGSFWTHTIDTRIEVTGKRKDGSCFPLELSIGRVDINDEPLFAATLHDITERKLAEHECHSLLQGNRFLIHKSLAVQEEERRHLARELHDELGQCMTAIQADAELIHELSRNKDQKVTTSAEAIVSVSSRMYDVVHSMMQRLRPSVLDDLGLVAALEEEIEAWQARFPHVNCSFSRDGELMGLGERINISLYRIVQESLTNIAKHADATQVTLKLARQQQTLTLSIEDNGCGMDTDNPGRGLGLIGMRERVEALSGALSVQSAPGKGVTIRVSIPLDK